MPSISGRHNGRRVLLPVTIIRPDDRAQYGRTNASFLQTTQVFRALVDTGATSTMISRLVAFRMKLAAVGKMAVFGVHGSKYLNAYLFHVGFNGSPVPLSAVQVDNADPDRRWLHVHVLRKVIRGAELPENEIFDVLLGMDVLGTGTLVIDRRGTFDFTF